MISLSISSCQIISLIILPFAAAADLCLCFYLLAQELCVALVQPFRNEIQAGGIKVRINDYVLFIRTADGP
jgi:hypothetical protein